ncbi:MAG: hypothetical protein K9H64_08995 [Bacteroidales bacterium]|nr:hypothetical protein [Bacteroidales bacterium]MCF8456002.1 hypothetical protein [Bacteroidales bacterium]
MNNDDPYLELIDEQWPNIVMMYEAFGVKKPIIEFNVADNKIYSYPAIDYVQALSSPARDRTMIQYKEATRNNRFILFVKDAIHQKLRSYTFDLPSNQE